MPCSPKTPIGQKITIKQTSGEPTNQLVSCRIGARYVVVERSVGPPFDGSVMYFIGRYSAISWELNGKGVLGKGKSVADPRSGEHLKSNILVSYHTQRYWLTKLAVQDLSDGKSAVRRDVGATSAPAHHRRGKNRQVGFQSDAAEDHPHHHRAKGNERRRSLQEHTPGKCQHAMALNHQGPATILRLMMEVDGRSTAEASDILTALVNIQLQP